MTARPTDPRPDRTLLGPWTKGLALDGPCTVDDARSLVAGAGLGDAPFTWPLLTLDADAIDHNVRTAARTVSGRGAFLAPHVKTHMSPEIWARQEAAGAWGATVATPSQWRAVRAWGTRRLLLANELVDAREAAAWRREAERAAAGAAPPLETLVYVDSTAGVAVLADAFAAADPEVRRCLGVLVEVGVPGGRTGTRTPDDAARVAAEARRSGLRVLGAAGYEGSVAAGVGTDELAAVAHWLRSLRAVGERLLAEGLVDGSGGSAEGARIVLSAGGSSFLDVVLDTLTVPLAGGTRAEVIVRSGASVIADHGFYARMDPWSRLGAEPLRPAATVWGQVLSAPEPGLVHVGVGRRDVGDDLDVPVVLGAGTPGPGGPVPLRPLPGVRVVALNDQHAHLRGDLAGVAPGDVVALGISHPCTTLDRWRVAPLVSGERVSGLATFDF